jgi:hypothetical protein
MGGRFGRARRESDVVRDEVHARGVRVGRRRTVALRAALLAGLFAMVCAPAASAIVVHISEGRTLSYSAIPGTPAPPLPLDLAFHNLDYNGGPVMTSNTNYTFYWAPAGSTPYPSDYQPGINQFFEDLAHESGSHTNVDSVATQYNNVAGEFANYNSHFGGAIVDTNPYPASGCSFAVRCLTDAQIRAELTSYIAAHNLPSDLTHEYFVLTPPGVEGCLEGTVCSAGTSHPSYCAYHGAIKVAGGSGVIVYANDPYVAGGVCDTSNHPNGTTADATIAGGLSHEHVESLTDPEPNNAWTDWAGGPLGWGYEIGDKCRTFYEPTEYGTTLGVAPNGARYNQLINGHPYWFQQEWSNQGHACMQHFTFKGEMPKASFTYSTNATNPELVTLDGSSSTAPGGVAYYEWQLNETSIGSSPFETSVPTLTHEFAKSGIYNVALTVFAADGTSYGTAHSINASEPPEPKITSISPANGTVNGGTPVTITGAGFRNVTAVKFGTAATSAYTVNSEASITATAPAGKGTVDVSVANTSGTTEPAVADQFTYKQVPSVTAVSPAAGPEAGGTTVTVTGTFLSGATAVRFGSKPAAGFTVNSAASITATAPAGSGSVDVTVTTPEGGSATRSADQFRYLAAPTVTSLSPSSGHEVGGTSIAIAGANLNGATSVKFGSTPASSFTVNSASSITAAAPAGSGSVDVTVTTPEGSSATNAGDVFSYLPSPAVTSVSPNGGPEGGGTTVTITGANLSGATAVKFGSRAAASFAVNSSTSMTATAPSGEGIVDVTVSTPEGTSAVNAGDRFAYEAPPIVAVVSPSTGSEAGGTVVTISGANFTGATAVSFGNAAATSFMVNSSTSITATSPGGAGTIDVAVTTPAGTSAAVAADQFSYALPPAVTAISPTSGPGGGGTTVTITGTNLTGATSVDFGLSPALSYAVNSSTSITATAPAGLGAVDLTVTTPGGTSLTSFADVFSYEASPTVTGVSPASGPEEGGTTVTITGTNLTGTYLVAFGSWTASSFHVNSPTSLTAVVPSQAVGTVDVWVANGVGASAMTAADHFTYLPRPVVTKIAPKKGAAAGGTPITITGTNLTGVTAVNFGSTPAASIHVNSATSVTAVSPAGTAGSVNVTVTGASNGTSVIVARDVFKFGAPTITAVSPASGPKAGGTLVTVTGSGFAPGVGATTFKIGSLFAGPATCSSMTRCTLTTPAAKTASAVDIVAKIGTISSAKSAADRFSYN